MSFWVEECKQRALCCSRSGYLIFIRFKADRCYRRTAGSPNLACLRTETANQKLQGSLNFLFFAVWFAGEVAIRRSNGYLLIDNLYSLSPDTRATDFLMILRT